MNTNSYTYKSWNIKYNTENENWVALKLDELTSKQMYLQALTLKEVKENINKAIIMGLNPWLLTEDQVTRDFALEENMYYCSICFSDLNAVVLKKLHNLITKRDLLMGGYLECEYNMVNGNTRYILHFEYDSVNVNKYFQNLRNKELLQSCAKSTRKLCKG